MKGNGIPPGWDRGWENRGEQKGFRAMVSDTAGSALGCPQKLSVTQIPVPRVCSWGLLELLCGATSLEKHTSKLLTRLNVCCWFVRELSDKGKSQLSEADRERHLFGLDGGLVQVQWFCACMKWRGHRP